MSDVQSDVDPRLLVGVLKGVADAFRIGNQSHPYDIAVIEQGADRIAALEAEVAALTIKASQHENEARALREDMREAQRTLAIKDDEVAALREERDAVLSDWNKLVRVIGSPTNGGAIGHAGALREDAERYRWLSEHTVHTGLSRWMGKHQFLDAAIDAARGKG